MDSADKAKKDFFISYTGADEQIASWIGCTLEDAGYDVVLQAWDMRQAGRSVIGNIDEAAINCARTIAVISPEYFASKFTVPEWQTAMHSDPTGQKGLLIPVIVRPHEIDGVMKRLAYISFIGLDEDQAETALLNGVSTDKRFKPATKPAYTLNRAKKKPRFPGTLPDHHNLPHRNPNFSGREQLLLNLRESLTKGQKTALTQQALYGLGGIGKTQLAVEYVYRHSASYEVIWWIRSEEPSTLASDYAGLALELDLPEKEEANQALVVQSVMRWLERNSDWLLIFDNARDADSIRSFLPRSAIGHVLITSRNPDWKSVGNPLQIEVWERSESVEFLLKRTGRTDDAGADALAEALGDLPLALEQAAAYCDNKKKSFADYLTLFNTRRAELWNREKAPDGYHDTVATTWSLAFEEIRKVPMAEELLSLCSVVAPDAIPRTLLNKALADYTKAVKKAKSVDEFVIDEAYEALRSYSLITLEEKFVTVHRLVQSVVRDQMGDDFIVQYRQVMVQALGEQFPQEGYREYSCWVECAMLLPHAQTLLEDDQYDHDVVWLTRSFLLGGLAGYHYGRGLYAETEPLLRRSLEITEKQLGLDHFEVLKTLNNLGLSLKSQGKYQDAEELIRCVLEIKEKNMDMDDPSIATSLINLATVLLDQGEIIEAEVSLRRALKIRENLYGLDNPDVALNLNNLAELLRLKGENGEAEPLYRRSLAIREKHYEPDHPLIATSLNNLGLLLTSEGKCSEAELLLRRALAICEKQLGSDHPNTQTVKANLDTLLRLMQSAQD
ncbi:tetratricopeptide repeat protein [Chlorobaculum thiosulfatiphilum]|uniref:Tetratricopeptide repeat protein n=1 Tax=Chlorobaculum thiosulfatiphilum TaxID=115852 RepID=A0A5C4S783_CHLTI|nr:FxSxx-COOH system tetratricopeptide repeat protein [Chlorobaculum thiosulfatiphilum]TNJ39354.1 tetratricopeptide repeat protein [Chlorobaculum thiosulfatiphilum]